MKKNLSLSSEPNSSFKTCNAKIHCTATGIKEHILITNFLIYSTKRWGWHAPGNMCEVPLSLAAEADTPLASRRRARPWRPSLLWCWELSGGLGGLLSRQRPIRGRLVPTVIENLCIWPDRNAHWSFIGRPSLIQVCLPLDSTYDVNNNQQRN